jgi:hypothetical protein
MKAISAFTVLALLIGGITFFRTKDYDTGWQYLEAPQTDNVFVKKQAEMMQLSGAYRKLKLSKNEQVTVKIKYGPDPKVEEKTIQGKDSSKVTVAVYNYPGRYTQGRKEHVTEVKIEDGKKVERWMFDRPLHYSAGSLLNHGVGDYRELLTTGEKTIYSLEITIEKKEAEQSPSSN